MRSAAGQTVMLDLKGVGQVGPETLRHLHARSVEHPLWVCARWWPSALSFEGATWAKVLLSSRGRAEIARLRHRLRAGHVPYGVSLHLSMLTPALVREVQDAGALVMTWPVDDRAALERAQGLGVDGAITKDLAIVQELVTSR